MEALSMSNIMLLMPVMFVLMCLAGTEQMADISG
jgi:hypothetical protein